MTDRSARFWDRAAKGYARKPVPDEAAFRRKLALTQGALCPTDRLLEVGCGTGGTAIEHAPYVAEVLAIDSSPRMVGIARAKASAAGVRNVRFEASDLATLTPGRDRFGAVLMLSLLHLLPDPGAALRLAHGLLPPGGLLVTNTPCLAETAGAIRPVAKLAGCLGLFPPVLTFLAERDVTRLTDDAGFAPFERYRPDAKASLFLMARRR